MSLADWFTIGGLLAYVSPKASLRAANTVAATRPELAFRYYARAARAGLPEAEYRLAQCYLAGTSVPASRAEAAHWFEKAGLKGHVAAQSALAELYLLGAVHQTQAGLPDDGETAAPDYVMAARWARAAAVGGSAEGQAVLAAILMSGPADMRDAAESLSWFKRSAQADCPGGMLGYGLALLRASGDAATLREGAGYLTKAANAGLPAALHFAGVAYEHGLGVPKDATLAASFYRRAAEKGSRLGQVRWGLALIRGFGVTAAPLDGQTWLTRAAITGDPDATLMLASLAANDPGSQDDQSHIFRAFEQRAASGDPAAAYNLAVCLAKGIGTPRDEQEAVFWLSKAAPEIPAARYWYGQMLAIGRRAAQELSAGRNGTAQSGQNRQFVVEAESAWPEARLKDIHAGKSFDFSEMSFHDGHAPERPGTNPQLQMVAELEQPSGSATEVKRLALPSENVGQRQDITARAVRTGVTQLSDPVPQAPAISGQDVARLCTCESGLTAGRCCQIGADYRASTEQMAQSSVAIAGAAEALAAGDEATCERLVLSALEADPRSPAALWLLFQIRNRGGRSQAAAALLQRLVAIDPNNVEATQALAMLHFRKGALDLAEPLARNAVRLAPSDPASHNLIGMIMTEAQHFQTGEFHYRRVLELSGSRDPILLANLAWNLKGQGKLAQARELYEDSVAGAPAVFQTLFGWAQLEEASRNFAAAGSLLDQAAAIRADDPGLKVARANLEARQGRDESALAQFALAADGASNDGHGAIGMDSNLLLSKGRSLDRLQRYDEAFACFAEAKRIVHDTTGKSYQEQLARDVAGRLRRFFTKGRLAHLPPPAPRLDGPQPLFILGFPRSGTTLLEQVLSCHPNISAGDELPFINELSDAMPRLLGSPLPYPEALSELWMGDGRRGLELLRDVYMRRAEDQGVVRPGSTWFTDKMPLNEMHLGLICLLFPQSPLIHMHRHPLDAVLSAFSHQMSHGYFCAYALETAARHYVLVMDTVQQYLTQMQPRYLAVRYEDLVAGLPKETRRILDFAGETFDERCINFHDNLRLPNTPSYLQVSEKLYNHSTYRYRHYRKHLESVLPILQPVIDRLGYAVD